MKYSSNQKKKTLYVCTACGTCCTWSGYVRVTDAEIDKMATFLNLSIKEFIDKYTILTDDRRGLSLTEKENDHCIFYEEPAICKVYPVRPKQCRNFPNRWNFDGFRKQCRCIAMRYRKISCDVTTCRKAYYPDKK